MQSPDDIIHQPLRLRVMAALVALDPDEGLDFTRLKKLTGATDGNLGAHIDTLGRAEYARIEKSFVARRPQTMVFATAKGRAAFLRHVAFLRLIIEGGDGG